MCRFLEDISAGCVRVCYIIAAALSATDRSTENRPASPETKSADEKITPTSWQTGRPSGEFSLLFSFAAVYLAVAPEILNGIQARTRCQGTDIASVCSLTGRLARAIFVWGVLRSGRRTYVRTTNERAGIFSIKHGRRALRKGKIL